MSCCVENARAATVIQAVSTDEMQVASRALGDGLRQLDLSVPGVHCGLCIKNIEETLGKISGVAYVRVNLTARRVTVRWKDGETPPDVVDPLRRLGYEAHIFDMAQEKDPTFTRLLIALGVAAFASSNVMLLSVAVWSGADAATRDMFHWISGLIALPTLIYSGRIFYVSAWNALRTRRVNMDVPIALAITLAFGMSVYETLHHGQHAYFDASVTLLFFLLIGRTLDYMMRARARSAVRSLAQLGSRGAVVIGENDERNYLPVNEIRPGMRIILAAGERVPVDAKVEEGRSELDCAIASGESDAVPVGPGSDIRAGTLNLSTPLVIRATAEAKDSFLAEMVRLMDVAEGGRAYYRRLADRASELYVPMVHTIAFAAFVGWMFYTGGDWYRSIYIAICTLIITCPCALALAVPIVQVVAARRLFENGIMIKDGSAMERMAEVDTAIFDKTGTLTLGQPRLIDADAINPHTLEIAAELSLYSRHPLSRALALFSGAKPMTAFTRIEEVPGAGIEAELNGAVYRLGKRDWADNSAALPHADGPETCLSIDGKLVQTFRFEDQPREDAAGAIATLKRSGLKLRIISGDKRPAVERLAGYLGVDNFKAEVLPADKSELVQKLSAEGSKVLMVGDGLNDAPALVAAHVSMAPATAADIGRNAADFVFLRESLSAVPLAFAVSKEAGKLISQNFALSIGYNIIAVPIAIFGYVTPLVAALSMSLSSIVVVSNALRLRAGKQKQQTQKAIAPVAAIKEAHK
ncbi:MULTISPECIES: cation-translocating P-type ATPase [Brucella/Ochrobactrum group]|jgi:Cu2+-exporting ATPase|uniref:Cation-translocating P-type ATPase n=1 Tax=Brucella pseudintermedia TaxID=370111 RepID=A0ABY5UBH8_9HYPH|nr:MULTISPECIES: cation-translocating P-type ATPase [Brucella/Ochrobactrum group]KAB2682141.1 cadmium-translocating P-type ATPase [Brucella pseudintermedia]NKE75785.1 cadmium-translocating P-type ATPase [Ochrobactrum sp. MC-1LL]TWH02153.1 Cu2+-exporting ATPase [Ochrobactrum sp. J50]UWL60082.1 cation-translocating P-type ATPase [Brucella pseudintermedia]WPM80502.1 cation-translocating P-type ATPase [Brucella pseudintermedia]